MYIVSGILILVCLGILWFSTGYNKLKKLQLHTEDQFSQIAISLQRRYSLIPNLVSCVKGYANHEAQTLHNIVLQRARQSQSPAEYMEQTMDRDSRVSTAMRQLFAVMENYPQLKTDHVYQHLMHSLTDTENKIQFARQFYNDALTLYRVAKASVPNNIIACVMNFPEYPLYETSEEAKGDIQVSFTQGTN